MTRGACGAPVSLATCVIQPRPHMGTGDDVPCVRNGDRSARIARSLLIGSGARPPRRACAEVVPRGAAVPLLPRVVAWP